MAEHVAARDPRADRRASRPPSAPWRRLPGTARAAELASRREAVLEVTDVRLRPGAAPISLTVRAGEILGLAGLEGQGQVALRHRALRARDPGRGPGRRAQRRRVDAGRRLPAGDRGTASRTCRATASAEGLFFSLSIAGELRGADAARREPPRRPALAPHPRPLPAGGRAPAPDLPARERPRRHAQRRQPAEGAARRAGWPPARACSCSTTRCAASTPTPRRSCTSCCAQLADEGLAIVFVSTEILELLVACDRIARVPRRGACRRCSTRARPARRPSSRRCSATAMRRREEAAL